MTFWMVLPTSDTAVPLAQAQIYTERSVAEAAQEFPECIYFYNEEALEDPEPSELDLLEEQLHATLDEINNQIGEVEDLAERQGCSPVQLRNMNGGFLLAPLLCTKADLLLHIVAINKGR